MERDPDAGGRLATSGTTTTNERPPWDLHPWAAPSTTILRAFWFHMLPDPHSRVCLAKNVNSFYENTAQSCAIALGSPASEAHLSGPGQKVFTRYSQRSCRVWEPDRFIVQCYSVISDLLSSSPIMQGPEL